MANNQQPAPPQDATALKRKIAVGSGTAGAIGLAIALAAGALKPDEGKRNVSYFDIARIPTSCYGHTGPDVHVGERKTDAECDALLADDVGKHLRGVLRCSPQLAGRPYQLAAATRLTFNIGVTAYCGSSIAAHFDAGDWRGACDRFLAWDKARVKGQLVRVQGLANRRQRERAMCLTGL